MLKFDSNGKASLYPYKVRYKDTISFGDNIQENWALPDKQWWIDTAAKHDEITIVEFVDVEITKEMQERFNAVKDSIVEGFRFDEYILNGEFPKGIIRIPESIRPQIQEKQQLLMLEEDKEKRKEIREEIQAMIPSPSLEEMLDFVQENFKK
jgi:hypothetical protein